MSYEDAVQREIEALEALQRAVTERGRLDAKASIYSQHRQAYDAAVESLLTAVQAYEAASSDVLKASSGNAT